MKINISLLLSPKHDSSIYFLKSTFLNVLYFLRDSPISSATAPFAFSSFQWEPPVKLSVDICLFFKAQKQQCSLSSVSELHAVWSDFNNNIEQLAKRSLRVVYYINVP